MGNQVAACALLAEYHEIFSLEPGELGCTDLVKHKIRVVDDEHFKGFPHPWWMKSRHM